MTTRKLATIRIIDSLREIDGADKIEIAAIGGWDSVVSKGSFKPGDKIVYCEIDSWIPTKLAPYLSKDKAPRVYRGVTGERLKTTKIKGVISQGLVLSVPEELMSLEVNTDVTDILGIIKYEENIIETEGQPKKPYIEGEGESEKKSNFPDFLARTNQPRLQNMHGKLVPMWEITEKLDGSSMTVYYKNGEIGVCSHNVDLKEDPDNAFWRTAIADKLVDKLKELGKNIALQGELIGEKINNNPYKIVGKRFYLFDIYDINERKYFEPYRRQAFAQAHNIEHVPIVKNNVEVSFSNMKLLQEEADTQSTLCPSVKQEGYVYKCANGPITFKVISNGYLFNNKPKKDRKGSEKH